MTRRASTEPRDSRIDGGEREELELKRAFADAARRGEGEGGGEKHCGAAGRWEGWGVGAEVGGEGGVGVLVSRAAILSSSVGNQLPSSEGR